MDFANIYYNKRFLMKYLTKAFSGENTNSRRNSSHAFSTILNNKLSEGTGVKNL